MSPVQATLEVIAASLEGADPEEALARALRSSRDLSSVERGQVARDALGTACHRLRLRAYAEAAGVPVSPESMLLAFWVRELRLERATLEAGFPGLGLTLKEAGSIAACEPTWPRDAAARLAVQESLPTWIAELWIAEWGEQEAFALAAAMNRPGPITLRANLLQGDRDSVARRLAAEGISTVPGSLAPTALQVQGRANLNGSRAWREGAFEIQDEGSQLIIDACAARPGERWLDLCAGAGGKTLGLAAAIGNRGELWAASIGRDAQSNLRARLRRSGAVARVIELEVGNELAALGAERFDGVLVDAPCSELGTLRRHVGARWRIQPEYVTPLPELQRRLIGLGQEHLVPGGRLVYATCTLRRAENDYVVGAGWETRTLAPHREGTDGFFIAGRPGCDGGSRLK